MRIVPVSTERYAERHAAPWRAVYPAAEISWEAPRQYGETAVDFRPHLVSTMPELGVLIVDGGMIAGPDGWVIGRGGALLRDLTWYGETFPFQWVGDKRHRLLKGACVNLASDWGAQNYGHFLLDCLPRLHLFLAAGFAMGDADFFLLPKPPSKGADRMIDRLCIPREKIVWTEAGEVLVTELLIAPSFPGVRRNYPPWVPKFLSSSVALRTAGKERKVYLRRKAQTRNIRNEADLEPLLQEFGFAIYEPGSVEDEPGLLQGVDCVIGTHDAGLANIAFCRPGTTVVEIVPTDHVYPYYYTLASGAGLRYGYLAASSDAIRPVGAWGPSPYDFTINENDFRGILHSLSRLAGGSR
ncbi:MAG: glycosyltransferase family 61 protein [Acidobacteria bacterium]|nr:glycosyltransferase family 61 protein [Acidobacteriota bacterium]